MRLLDIMSRADVMIVIDTLCNGCRPGTLTKLTSSEIQDRVAAKNSLHQVSFLETIAYANFLGCLPETILIGCEPKDLSAWGMELTSEVAEALPDIIRMVLEEIEKAGSYNFV